MGLARRAVQPAATVLLVGVACRPGLARPVGEWQTGLKGTHYWDCNGQGCDGATLVPWNKHKFVSSPQYAPTDPRAFGGPEYGEKLWLTGAASDDLAQQLGISNRCCGNDRRSPGCGRCLLVRNPNADHPEWTAVIMKKSRCPPESHGCEPGKLHIDIAAPGYDNTTYSTANICGEKGYNTYIDKKASGVCANTHGGCTCEGMPDDTDAAKALKEGCILFGTWGWKRGDPTLEYQPVECPKAWEQLIRQSFSARGVEFNKEKSSWTYYAVFVVVGVIIASICSINRIVQTRREERTAAIVKDKKRRRTTMRKPSGNFGGGKARDSSDSSSASSSSGDESERGTMC